MVDRDGHGRLRVRPRAAARGDPGGDAGARRQRMHARVAEVLAGATDGDASSRRAQHLVAALPLSDATEVTGLPRRCTRGRRALELGDRPRTGGRTRCTRTTCCRPRRGESERDELKVARVIALARAGRGQTVLDVVERGLLDAVRDGRPRRPDGWPAPCCARRALAVGVVRQGSRTGARAPGRPRAVRRRRSRPRTRACWRLSPSAAATTPTHRRRRAQPAARSRSRTRWTIRTSPPRRCWGARSRLGHRRGGAPRSSSCSAGSRSSAHRQAAVDEVIRDALLSLAWLNLGDLGASAERARRGYRGSRPVASPPIRAQMRWIGAGAGALARGVRPAEGAVRAGLAHASPDRAVQRGHRRLRPALRSRGTRARSTTWRVSNPRPWPGRPRSPQRVATREGGRQPRSSAGCAHVTPPTGRRSGTRRADRARRRRPRARAARRSPDLAASRPVADRIANIGDGGPDRHGLPRPGPAPPGCRGDGRGRRARRALARACRATAASRPCSARGSSSPACTLPRRRAPRSSLPSPTRPGASACGVSGPPPSICSRRSERRLGAGLEDSGMEPPSSLQALSSRLSLDTENAERGTAMSTISTSRNETERVRRRHDRDAARFADGHARTPR